TRSHSVGKGPGFSPCPSARPAEGHAHTHTLPVPRALNMTLSFSFTVEQDIPVQGLKPAQVKVYDYYETGECGAEGVPVS
uniref:Alpha-macroglobulin receptor-binding domain-containing protein n=1 Tax=Phasianus colchicus TaxID=9054 RepID=A0A669QU23_PHACC